MGRMVQAEGQPLVLWNATWWSKVRNLRIKVVETVSLLI